MKLQGNRYLFNVDFGIYGWNPELWQPEGGTFSARAIHNYIKTVAEGGVDTFIINPNTMVAWYPSKAIPTILDGYVRGDREFVKGCVDWTFGQSKDVLEGNVAFLNRYLDLAEAGTDWLAETAKACRIYGMKPWVSVRMNDMHGAGDPEGSYMRPPIFDDKRNRLRGKEYALVDSDVNPQNNDGALNYEFQEVRDHMFSLIREVVEEYDFEGLELDWMREPACCEPVAAQESIDLMTGWIMEIRALTDKKAKETGRPYPLGLRIAGNYGVMKSIGLDVEALVKNKIIDFLCPSNHVESVWDMPYDDMRKAYGNEIMLYAVTEATPNWGLAYSPEHDLRGLRSVSASPELLKGNIAGQLAIGADGVELYNFYTADQERLSGMRARYDVMKGLCNLEVLRGEPKLYVLSSMPGPCWYPPFDLPEQLPVLLEPSWRQRFKLLMCAEPEGNELKLIIQVVTAKKEDMDRIGVSFNGSWPDFHSTPANDLLFEEKPFTQHLPEQQAYNFCFNISLVKDGWNTIDVYNHQDGRLLKIEGLEIAVRGI